MMMMMTFIDIFICYY